MLKGRAYCDAHPSHLTPLNLKRRAWVSAANIPKDRFGFIVDPACTPPKERDAYQLALNTWWNNLSDDARAWLGPDWERHCTPPPAQPKQGNAAPLTYK